MDGFIRYRREIELKETVLSDVKVLINEYTSSLKYPGDNFMAKMRTQCRHFLIGISNERRYVGLTGITDKALTLFYIAPEFKFMEKQILEKIVKKFALEYSYVASWDYHALPIILEHAKSIETQGYQFQLLSKKHLRHPVSGLKVRLAKEEDVEFMDNMDFINNAQSYVKRQEAWIATKDNGTKAGIGLISPMALQDDYLDIGMFTIKEERKKGIGRSILALLMQMVDSSGRIPVAACLYNNHTAKRTLESSGMTCIGTILKVNFPDKTMI